MSKISLAELKKLATSYGIEYPKNATEKLLKTKIATHCKIQKLPNPLENNGSEKVKEKVKEKESKKVVNIEGLEVDPTDPTIASVLLADKLKKKRSKRKWKKAKKEKKIKKSTSFAERAKIAAANLIKAPYIDNYVNRDISQQANIARAQATSKVRVLLTVYDPSRQQRSGEIFRVRNAHTGNIGEFVPYNTDQPIMLNKITVNILKETMYSRFVTSKKYSSSKVMESEQKPAFNVQILPQLTDEEIADMRRQALANKQLLEEKGE